MSDKKDLLDVLLDILSDEYKKKGMYRMGLEYGEGKTHDEIDGLRFARVFSSMLQDEYRGISGLDAITATQVFYQVVYPLLVLTRRHYRKEFDQFSIDEPCKKFMKEVIIGHEDFSYIQEIEERMLRRAA